MAVTYVRGVRVLQKLAFLLPSLFNVGVRSSVPVLNDHCGDQNHLISFQRDGSIAIPRESLVDLSALSTCESIKSESAEIQLTSEESLDAFRKGVARKRSGSLTNKGPIPKPLYKPTLGRRYKPRYITEFRDTLERRLIGRKKPDPLARNVKDLLEGNEKESRHEKNGRLTALVKLLPAVVKSVDEDTPAGRFMQEALWIATKKEGLGLFNHLLKNEPRVADFKIWYKGATGPSEFPTPFWIIMALKENPNPATAELAKRILERLYQLKPKLAYATIGKDFFRLYHPKASIKRIGIQEFTKRVLKKSETKDNVEGFVSGSELIRSESFRRKAASMSDLRNPSIAPPNRRSNNPQDQMGGFHYVCSAIADFVKEDFGPYWHALKSLAQPKFSRT